MIYMSFLWFHSVHLVHKVTTCTCCLYSLKSMSDEGQNRATLSHKLSHNFNVQQICLSNCHYASPKNRQTNTASSDTDDDIIISSALLIASIFNALSEASDEC